MKDIDKVIVTNGSALARKYGADARAVKKAVEKLVLADKKRGIDTKLVELDDERALRALGGKPVNHASDPRQSKRAIDTVYRAYTPDYLMILGSTDVVPHQDVRNPAYDPG